MSDFVFRIAFIVIFTSLTIVRVTYKRRAGALGEGIFPKSEGCLLNCIRGVLGSTLFFRVFFFIAFPEALPYAYINLPKPARLVGAAGGLCGVFIIALSHNALGKNFSSTVIIKKNHNLVTTGPYRTVRHPMYLGYLILFISVFLLSENWVIGVSGSGIILSLMTLRLRKEEKELINRFGIQYITYMRKTGKFFPWRFLPGKYFPSRVPKQFNTVREREGK